MKSHGDTHTETLATETLATETLATETLATETLAKDETLAPETLAAGESAVVSKKAGGTQELEEGSLQKVADAVEGEDLEGVDADGGVSRRGDVKILHRSNAPKSYPCPSCGVRGRRVRKRVLEVTDLEPGQRVRILGQVGVYKAKCDCRKYYTSEIKEASKGTEYSNRVRDEVVRLVVEERLTYEQVRERLRDDYLITLSIGTIHNWLKERGETPARTRRPAKAKV